MGDAALIRALDLAQRQYGLVTRDQAIDVGLHPRAVDRLVSSGRWRRVERGVYCVVGTPRSWEQRALALVLAAGPTALVADLSAAYLYGLENFGPTGRISIVTPRHLRRRVSGADVHETLDAEHLDPRTRRLIPVTGPARTVLDVCWVVDNDLRALEALDEMLRLRHVTWAELWECLVVHARRGRNGVARFRRVLVRRWGVRAPRGHFAHTVQALLVDAGLPQPEGEHPVTVEGVSYRFDLAYPDVMVAIELDDKGSHLTDLGFERDPIRENRLKLAGWLVLRYTWDRLVNEPEIIVKEVRAAFLQRSCAA